MLANIIQMYEGGDGHVEVLSASVRSMDHFLYALHLGSDIITAPYKTVKEWGDKAMPRPNEGFIYHSHNLKPVYFQNIDLNRNWHEFKIAHELTAKGIERFSQDWNALVR